MTDPTETAVDFGGCNRKCRQAGAHTLVWGECEHAPEPEPTVSLSRVYKAADGFPATGFDTYTVQQLAELLEPALRRVTVRLGPNSRALLERGETVGLSGGEYADLAREAAHAIVHRTAPAVVSAAAPSTDHTTPSRRAGLRDALRRAVCEAEGFAWDSDMLEPDEYGDHADTVLAVLYREWPWLRAEAEDAAAPSTDQAALIELGAQAIWARYSDAEPSRHGLVMANPHAAAEAVLSVLPTTAEDHRLALSEALGLGTGAPWDVIHDRVTELGLPPLDQDPVARRLGLLPAPADRAAVRCSSCEHEAQYHDVDGRCWFTVEQGVFERDAVCSCQLRRLAAEAPATAQADEVTAEHHIVDGAKYLCHADDHYCPPAVVEPAEAADTETQDVLRLSEEICPGFPDRCPNLRTIEPEPGVHLGGIRCGCADEEPS